MLPAWTTKKTRAELNRRRLASGRHTERTVGYGNVRRGTAIYKPAPDVPERRGDTELGKGSLNPNPAMEMDCKKQAEPNTRAA